MPALCHEENRMAQNRRKQLRLEQYDYSNNGAYFVTVCTHQKKELFGCVGEPSEVADKIRDIFEEVLSAYPRMQCPVSVVMPNHLHALLVIDKLDDDHDKTVAEFMRAFKSKSTVDYIRMVREGKAIPFDGKLWQRSYYDHIIRNEQDFREVWSYIEENPLRWQLKRQR